MHPSVRGGGGKIYPIAFQTSPVPVRGFLCTVFRRFLTSEHPSLYINLEKLISTGLHKYSGLQIQCGCSVGVVCLVFGQKADTCGPPYISFVGFGFKLGPISNSGLNCWYSLMQVVTAGRRWTLSTGMSICRCNTMDR